mmetsp:Transcript_106912/g.340553  ORF Transcript_106912/g.340553 Transcript_106912/m.340553 type:complete len:185 (+) Transcript_106912:1021-1575(+)
MGMGALLSITTGAWPRALELRAASAKPLTAEACDLDDARAPAVHGCTGPRTPVERARAVWLADASTSHLEMQPRLPDLCGCRGEVRRKREALGRSLLRSASPCAPPVAAGLARAFPGDAGRELQRSFTTERSPGSVRFCRSLHAISARCCSRSLGPSQGVSIAPLPASAHPGERRADPSRSHEA